MGYRPKFQVNHPVEAVEDCYFCAAGVRHTVHEELTHGDVQRRYRTVLDDLAKRIVDLGYSLADTRRELVRMRAKVATLDLEESRLIGEHNRAISELGRLSKIGKIPQELIANYDDSSPGPEVLSVQASDSGGTGQ